MRIRYLALPVFVAALVYPCGSSGAATVTPAVQGEKVTTVATVTPLDPATGAPTGAAEVVGIAVVDNGRLVASAGITPATGSDVLTAASTGSGTSGRPSAGGRALFRIDAWHQPNCILVVCAHSFRHITDVDAAWVNSWNWIKANAWAKYTPVDGGGFWHYDGQSQTFGGDLAHYYTWRSGHAGSGFFWRGTAQLVFSLPLVGDTYTQVSNTMRVHVDGTMWYSMNLEGG